MGGKLLARHAVAGKTDNGVRALAEHWTGPWDDGSLHHIGMAHERVLHLDAVNLVAAAVDHVLLAVEHAHVALGIDRADVARAPEAGNKILARRLRLVPVAAHHHRPAQPDLALRAAWHLAALLVHH